MVSEKEIAAALNKGAKTTKDIQDICYAGTTCGKCLMTIDAIVEEFHSKRPEDPQQSLQFG
jgi:bacterioferritin-associated ferredoxin